MLTKLFSIKREENTFFFYFLGIRIKHTVRYNKIYIVDENGKKKQVRKIKGLKINFLGSNSTVLVHKPIPKFINTAIILNNNCNFEIESSQNEIKNSKIFLTGDFCNIQIGKDFSATNNLNIYCTREKYKNVIIGNNCMFGRNIVLRTGDGHTIYDKNNKIINRGGDVIVKDNVWVCSNVTILKGVTIEKGCVIGIASLVTKNCDTPNSIYVGMPATLKKSNIFWDRKGIKDFEETFSAKNCQENNLKPEVKTSENPCGRRERVISLTAYKLNKLKRVA